MVGVLGQATLATDAGLLFIFGAIAQGKFAKTQAGIQRLVEFMADKPITRVFGTHIEMKATFGKFCP